jgi:3-methyladenine DNA glycosylase AlkD
MGRWTQAGSAGPGVHKETWPMGCLGSIDSTRLCRRICHMVTAKPVKSRNVPDAADRAVVRDALAMIATGINALADPKRAEGVFIVAKHQAVLKTTPWSLIAPWLRAVDNWETCDQLSAAVIATIVNAQPALAKHLLTLTKSKDQWQRRLAVATAASLSQHGRSQPATTAAVCRALEKDPEPKIRRAVEWARRELAKTTF